jgi:hypothetical protein
MTFIVLKSLLAGFAAVIAALIGFFVFMFTLGILLVVSSPSGGAIGWDLVSFWNQNRHSIIVVGAVVFFVGAFTGYRLFSRL